jgi:hypothetical protein
MVYCNFLLLMDVIVWISNECSRCMFLYLNICHLNPSKGEI